MKISRILVLLSLSFILTGSASSSLTVNAIFIEKIKVRIMEESGYMEFLKFKTQKTDNFFLVGVGDKELPEKYLKKNKLYRVTYG